MINMTRHVTHVQVDMMRPNWRSREFRMLLLSVVALVQTHTHTDADFNTRPYSLWMLRHTFILCPGLNSRPSSVWMLRHTLILCPGLNMHSCPVWVLKHTRVLRCMSSCTCSIHHYYIRAHVFCNANREDNIFILFFFTTPAVWVNLKQTRQCDDLHMFLFVLYACMYPAWTHTQTGAPFCWSSSSRFVYQLCINESIMHACVNTRTL
jgi:hypothetical protein